jgi:hypothetical protein
MEFRANLDSQILVIFLFLKGLTDENSKLALIFVQKILKL